MKELTLSPSHTQNSWDWGWKTSRWNALSCSRQVDLNVVYLSNLQQNTSFFYVCSSSPTSTHQLQSDYFFTRTPLLSFLQVFLKTLVALFHAFVFHFFSPPPYTTNYIAEIFKTVVLWITLVTSLHVTKNLSFISLSPPRTHPDQYFPPNYLRTKYLGNSFQFFIAWCIDCSLNKK